MSTDLFPLRDLAVDVATEAAALLLEGLGRERAHIGTKSTGTDMVTEMDRASEELIQQRIAAARPDDGMLGEEGTDRAGTTGVRWIVDPLDGTTNYLYGHPGFNVSIGVEVGGRPAVGVVFDVLAGDCFDAVAGAGARRGGVAIESAPPPPLAESLIATGFSYDPARRTAQARVLAEMIGHVRDVRRTGAAAVDLCSVAIGRVDAFFERGLAPWDRAGGEVVAREAGVLVTGLDGGPPGEDFVLAARPPLHGELLQLLERSGAAHVP